MERHSAEMYAAIRWNRPAVQKSAVRPVTCTAACFCLLAAARWASGHHLRCITMRDNLFASCRLRNPIISGRPAGCVVRTIQPSESRSRRVLRTGANFIKCAAEKFVK